MVLKIFIQEGKVLSRPHVELCKDEPQEGLTMEVQTLRDTIYQLTVKLDHSR